MKCWFLSTKFLRYFGYWWSSIQHWGLIISWKEFRSFIEVIAKISTNINSFYRFFGKFPDISVGQRASFGQSAALLPSKLIFHYSVGIGVWWNWDRRRRREDTRSLARLGGGSKRRGCWGRLHPLAAPSFCTKAPTPQIGQLLTTKKAVIRQHPIHNFPSSSKSHQQKQSPNSIFPFPPQPHQNPISQTLDSSQPRHQLAPTTPKPPKSQTLGSSTQTPSIQTNNWVAWSPLWQACPC